MHAVVNMTAITGSSGIAKFKKEFPDSVKVMRLLDVDWPCALSIYEHFATYISDGILVNGKPLIFICLQSALEKYEKSICRADEERISAFLHALITPAVEILASITIAGSDQVWDADKGKPLTLWIETLDSGVTHVTENLRPRNTDAIRDAINKYVLEAEIGMGSIVCR